MRKVLENKIIQEITLLIFSFILFTLNDWILILSWKGFLMGVIYFLILYIHAQVNRFFLLPLLLKKNKAVLYALFSIAMLLVFALILKEITENVIYKNCFLYKNLAQKTFHYQVGVLLGSLICILGSIQFIEFYRFQRLKTRRELLSNQTQLSNLKKQLNPHFLFNTLNTIYGISLKFPERTSELIIKVSQLLRYQMESSDKEFVSMDDEIDFISSYIELERERLGYRTKIDFDYQREEGVNYQIAPMLLITFVENAFKHGTCSIEDCYVAISIRIEKGNLYLHVRNSVPVKKMNVFSAKIGLENTVARLKLLYPNRYQLNTNASKEEFEVSLVINL
ncbi:histidine kinase [Sphingobacterium sp. DR205]|uniref:sensor histidine kinase n=1 Tax=Sphingobacterium sp. DR205 TaxID=2713573 RepID=UPI0013E46500|nr:histidine kinase [Sphingobacterium sp. DR205]QIH32586.1 histidine kinase [Sphingobacterium sp. DR205]